MFKPKMHLLQIFLFFCLLLIAVGSSKAGGLGKLIFSQPAQALQNPTNQLGVSAAYPTFLGHIGGISNAITGQGNYAFTNFGLNLLFWIFPTLPKSC